MNKPLTRRDCFVSAFPSCAGIVILGTGKTTLSSDPTRKLIGDDEHAWFEGGIYNHGMLLCFQQSGCYSGLPLERFAALLRFSVYSLMLPR